MSGKTEREREREGDRVHKEHSMYREEEKKRQSNITFTLLSNDWCLYTSGSYFFCARTRFPVKQFLLFLPRFPLSFFPFHSIPPFFQTIADGNKSTRPLFEEELSGVYEAWENNWKRTRGYIGAEMPLNVSFNYLTRFFNSIFVEMVERMVEREARIVECNEK